MIRPDGSARGIPGGRRRNARPLLCGLALIAWGLWPAAHRARAEPLALVGGHYLPITSPPVSGWTLLIENGRISAFGPGVDVPEDARRIELEDEYVLPGLIDVHSHIGVYPWPAVEAHADGNEMTDPVTPQVRAEDAFHVEDPALERALRGGVTALHVLPGSGNLIGGQTLLVKVKPGRPLEEIRIRGATPGMKMALGENPKGVYGERKQSPTTRMGNMALLREAFTDAREYGLAWRRYEERRARGDPKAAPPERKLDMEALREVLEGRMAVHVHCYRADEMLRMLDLAESFGFRVTCFHHAIEAWKIAPELARRRVAVAIWPDWWGFKMEAWDARLDAPRILQDAGVVVALHTDSSRDVQWMGHQAAKMVRYGLDPEEALKTITIHPATVLGLGERMGSLEAGKDADIAVFTAHPLDRYSLARMTIVDGEVLYEREAGP